jgi:hypothetical protein
VDPNTKTGARLVALPMGKGKRLDGRKIALKQQSFYMSTVG